MNKYKSCEYTYIKNVYKGDIMENVKEKWYEVMYNTRLDKLVLKKPRLRRKIIRRIKKHKFITTVFWAFITFSMLNIAMIVSFMKILQNI